MEHLASEIDGQQQIGDIPWGDGLQHWVNCFAHILNLAAQASLKKLWGSSGVVIAEDNEDTELDDNELDENELDDNEPDTKDPEKLTAFARVGLFVILFCHYIFTIRLTRFNF